jgi:hypothetical protein
LETVYQPKGCEKCDQVGYFGRLGLYEVMDLNNAIREAILDDKTSLEIEELAKEHGMVTLEQAGLIKVALGETSVEEVYRVARSEMNETKADQAEVAKQEPAPVVQATPAAPVAPVVDPVLPPISSSVGVVQPVATTLEVTPPVQPQVASSPLPLS